MDAKTKLRQSIDQARARLQKIEAQEKTAERRARARRAIVLGEAVMAAVARGEHPAISDCAGWLAQQPLRPQDRRAWNLHA